MNSNDMHRTRALLVFALILPGVFLGASPVNASATNGVIDSANSYAWGDWLGWVNFAAAGSNVSVTASRLAGYAWSSLYGWINLAPAGSGVLNDGSGTLSGSAWGENTGYISFSGVTIDTSSGRFSGTATSTNGLGSVTFDCANCAVVTDWRPATSEVVTIVLPPGGGSPTPTPTPTSPSTPTSSASSTPLATDPLTARIAELRALVASLLTRLAALQRLSCIVPDKDLSLGSTGSDVRQLQTLLNAQGFLVAQTGIGSQGMESEFFGAKTKTALARFQAFANINPASGFFGPLTRAYLRSRCTAQ